MDWQHRDPRLNPPYSPVLGYTSPREDIELMRPHQSTLSPTPYKEYSKSTIYTHSQESVPYHDNLSQQNFVQQDLDAPCEPTPWRSGFWRRFPWLGVAALIVSFLCMAAAVSVLVLSNQKPVTEWKFEPTVILAILSAVFNSALVFALSQGSGISWWHRALRGGTVGDLSRQWTFGTSLKASLLSGRHFNLTALATIIVALAVIDGPLLQRASTIVTQAVSGETSLKAALAPLLPPGYTAKVQSAGDMGAFNPSIITTDFAKVVSDYQKGIPINVGITECSGNCSAVVPAAGINVVCEAPVPTPFVPNPQDQEDTTMFSVYTQWLLVNCTESPGQLCPEQISDDGVEVIQLTVAYTQTNGECDGYLVSTTCNITAAVVEYQVELSGQTITLNNPSPRLNVVALSNERTVQDINSSAIGGLYLASESLFASNVTWQFEVVTLFTVINLDVFPSQYVKSGDTSDPGCPGNITWNDPTDDILTAFNEMMFRSAIRSAGNVTGGLNLEVPNAANKTFTSQSTVNATQSLTHNIFLTNFTYLVGAAAVMTLAILVVIPTFYGFWHLGRSISLDPIEIAKAFDAPILGGAAALSNADIDLLVKTVGKRRIVYGEMLQADGGGEKKLTMGILGSRNG